MPYRLGEGRAKLQLLVSAEMPYLIHEACVKLGTPSATRYVQEAICGRLSYDLDLPYSDLIAALPATRTPGEGLRAQRTSGPANTSEDVR